MIRHPVVLTLTMWTLALLATRTSVEARPRYARLTAAQVDAIVKPHMGKGERVDHAVFRGPLGPGPRAILVLTQRAEKGGASRLIGFVISGKRRLPLPIPKTHWPSGVEVAAVLLLNLDADKHLELVIMTTYMTGVGPTGARDQHENYVLDYDGKGFVRLARLEKRIWSKASARAVKRALLGKRRGAKK